MRTPLASKLMVVATLLLGASTTLRAEDACTAASFKGAFGYTLKGFVYDTRGTLYILAAAGRMVSNGEGAITGADAISYDGSIVKRKYSGTYTVNEDCTGSMVFEGDDTSITNASFVIVNDGKEVSLVQTDANFVVSGELKQQKQQAAATAQ
jgi:hypothetical protein